MTAAYEVVVPTYNVERTIADTLASLTAQTLPPVRILIADDESPDASVEVASAFPLVEVRRFAHSGLSGVQTRALVEVGADAVAFVDADDLWHPDTGRILHAALSGTDAGAVSVSAERFRDGDRPAFADLLPPVWTEVAYDDLVRTNTLRKAGTMYRTAALREIGGWQEDLPISGDHDIALRLMEAGHSVYTTSWRGLGYRVSGSNMSSDPAPLLAEQLRVALPRCGDEDAVRRQARTLWLRTLARAAHDGRDLRDVPPLTDLIPTAPPGQRALEALVRSPLRHGLSTGWRAWRAR